MENEQIGNVVSPSLVNYSILESSEMCATKYCNSKQPNNSDLTFHRFPNDPDIAKKWAIAINRMDLLNKDVKALYQNFSVCSKHFAKNDITNGRLNKSTVVPVSSATTKIKVKLTKGDEIREFIIDSLGNSNIDKDLSIKRKIEHGISNCLNHLEKIKNGVLKKKTKLEMETKSNKKEHNNLNQKNDIDLKCYSDGVNLTDHHPNEKSTQTPLCHIDTHIKYEKIEKRYRKIFFKEKRLKLLKEKRIEKFKQGILPKKFHKQITRDNFFELCRRFLTDTQLKIIETQIGLKHKSRKNNYNDDLKRFATFLYFLNPKCYDLLSKTMVLPPKGVVTRIFYQKKCNIGINDFVFKAIEFKYKNVSKYDKRFLFYIGYLNLTKNISYTKTTDEIIGYEDLGCKKGIVPATNALVFMIQHIKSGLRHAISYYFVNDVCDANNLKMLLFEVFEKLYEMNFNIVSLVVDNCNNYMELLHILNVNESQSYFLFNDQKINFVINMSHLLLALRNLLIENSFNFDFFKTVSWRYINDFYKKDVKLNLRLAPKLTEAHLDPNDDQKLKIKLAVEVFSLDVASGLEIYGRCLENDSIIETSEFIGKISKLYTQLVDGDKGFTSNDNLKCLKCAIVLIKTIQIPNLEKLEANNTNLVNCLNCWIITINSLIQIWTELKPLQTLKLASRHLFNAFDDHFSDLRKQNITPAKFVRAFKSLFVGDLFAVFDKERDNKDNKDFDSILKFSKSIENFDFIEPDVKCDSLNDLSSLKNNIKVDDIITSIPIENILKYLSSLVYFKCLERHTCDICESYGNDVYLFLESVIVTYFKESGNCDVTKIPHKDFFKFVSDMERIFFDNFLKNFYKRDLTSMLVTKLMSVPYTHPCGMFSKRYCVQVFVKVRLSYCLKIINLKSISETSCIFITSLVPSIKNKDQSFDKDLVEDDTTS